MSAADNIDAWFDRAPRYQTLPAQGLLLLVMVVMSPLFLSKRFRRWFMR